MGEKGEDEVAATPLLHPPIPHYVSRHSEQREESKGFQTNDLGKLSNP
jgi:hypothetical protein